MRYNHESYLPIRAFQPVLGRMTFHGGGGGGVLDDFSDAIGTGGGDTGLLNAFDEGAQAASDAAAAVDDAVFQPVTAPISQAASAVDDAVLQPITAPISDVGVAIDHAVSDVIPGGWGTLAQVAAAATGNPYIIGATSAGVNYAKNKDLQDALEAGLISGGTAGITQGIADAFELGDVGKAGLSAGIGGGIDYAKTGDINSALKAGAIAGGTSYAGSKLGEFSEPYFNGDAPIIDKSTPYSASGESTSDFQKVSDSTIDDIIRNNSNNSVTMTDTGVRVDPITLEPLPQNPNISNASLKTTPNQEELDKLVTEQNAKYPMEANIVDKSTPYSGDPIANESIYSKLKQLPEAAIDTGINYAKNLTGTQLALLGAGAYGLSNLNKSDQEPATTAAAADAANKAYTYGTAGKPSSNYLLKNRINASNIYSDAARYRPLTRYAEGGEVQHFGIGGNVTDALTRIAQPFEKAIVRPIGEAVPFVKDLAPYAGIAAGAMMGNPAVAAGIGGIASGFGKPGGFDMKRALMGGIAAYGMSNLAGGLEAAGGQSPSLLLDTGTDLMGKTSAAQLVESGLTPEEALKQSAQQNLQQGAPQASNSIFRDSSAIKRGIGNLLENSNTPAYKDAMAALKGNVGMFSTGLPIVMGTTGVMGVDESNALKAEYDKAAAANQADADKFNATVAAGKKRAQQAVTDNPYKFATGGEVNPPDDQTQLTSQTPMQSMQQTAPLQGLASNPQMQQPMGNIFNDGIRGLFSQLNRSNTPFNDQLAMPSFNDQSGSPQSVVIPSYGNNETPNGGASTPAIGGSFGGFGGNAGAFPLQGQYGIVKMAAGGMPPRFLSGGGDGMSDSIRANIEGTQEARLADGEFVIPADVVSHLGNGSSKAGAKQLYDMMDRVRKARTGNPKQGREIKPTKLMPV